MTEILLLLMQCSIGALVFSIGVGATLADITYLWQRPSLLLRSLLAMYVLVPLAAYLLVITLPLTQGAKAALLVLAVSAGAPLLPNRVRNLGDGAYAFSLVVTTSLLAVVVAPAWVALLAWHFGLAMELSWRSVAWAITKAYLVPLAIGMTLGATAPLLSRTIANQATTIAGVLLTLASIALVVLHWPLLLAVHWLGFAALLALMLMAVAIGHLLGGPRAGDRTTLAMACATRHLGVAVIVASTFYGPRTVLILTVYVAASLLISVPYLRWQRRRAQVDSAVAATADPGRDR